MNTPWIASPAIEGSVFAEIRRRTIFDCCKWDPQAEDVSVLSDTPLVLRADAWKAIAQLAEDLDRETRALENELLERTNLHEMLALSRALRKAIRCSASNLATSDFPRVHRYDFHFTTDGWRISEVNSDVPGGFIEASGFASLIAAACDGLRPCGDPCTVLVDAVGKARSGGEVVALIHATAYNDDRQVMAYLAKRFAEAGVPTVLAAPDHLDWRDRTAWLNSERLGAIVRFFPGEWLPNLRDSSGWPNLAGSSRTPLTNPASALLTQSKRLPLAWDGLRTPIRAWRRLLPETRRITWSDRRRLDPHWVYKPALGRVGDGVGLAGATSNGMWKAIRRGVRWHSRHWIAQRRFEAVPFATARGPMFPSMGVFVINGRACGVYGRMAPQALIDHRALDVAVLVERGAAAPEFRQLLPRLAKERTHAAA